MALCIQKGWMSKIANDMLLQATSHKELLTHLQIVSDICFTEGITLSPDKLEIEEKVPFAGFMISAAGMTPDPVKVAAIASFPLPANLTGSVPWTPGKRRLIPDALSQYPVFGPTTTMDAEQALCTAVSLDDPALRIIAEWGPLLPQELSVNGGFFDELRVEGGVLLFGERLFVPRLARPTIVDLLYASHLCINKTCELATQLYVWSTLRNDICNKIAICPSCVLVLPSQEVELIITKSANNPMNSVAIDLFDQRGHVFVVMVDQYSTFPLVHWLSFTSTEAVWNSLHSWFCVVGFHTSIKTDNGPQFCGQFSSLCLQAGIRHDTSSPYHPASNGLEEASVKSVKRLLSKMGGVGNPKFRSALLERRCTPWVDEFSPAKAFHAQQVRSLLPFAHQGKIFERQDFELACSKSPHSISMVGTTRGRALKPLVISQSVHIQDVTEMSWS
ncbi:uncharacterized protein LOC131887628 [Tigriopus californicus]|uniref:uncharacterized protein LOC131887628 n=1 Tax=Tigriopus californicus TaxID=6832 RepID=UPI0027DA6144|nr:uncharacterized protein LOC131887628 [Tigriopus californicus]